MGPGADRIVARTIAALTIATSIAIAAVACGGSDSTPAPAAASGAPCASAPLACVAGTTCWIDPSEATYECLPSGSAIAGAACTNVAGAPSCADGLTCFDVPGYDVVCTPLCDDMHLCADMKACIEIKIGSSTETISACRPAEMTSDGGAGGAGGHS